MENQFQENICYRGILIPPNHLDLPQWIVVINLHPHRIHNRGCYRIPYDTVHIYQYGRLFQCTTAQYSIKYTQYNVPIDSVPDTKLPITVDHMYVKPYVQTHSLDSSHRNYSLKIIISDSPENIQLITGNIHIGYIDLHIAHRKMIPVSDSYIQL